MLEFNTLERKKAEEKSNNIKIDKFSSYSAMVYLRPYVNTWKKV